MDVLESVIFGIKQEFKKAKQKHPEFPDCLVEMTAIMSEEAGEAIREANLIQFEDLGNLEQYKIELRQTAAVCIRILEKMELYENGLV